METTLIEPRRMREERGLTQIQLSFDADISLSTVQKFETGKLASPSLRTKVKLASAYRVQIDQINAYIESFSETSPQAA